MVSMLFRDPQARSSALAALGTLQPRAFGSLNRVETLDSASNYYLDMYYSSVIKTCTFLNAIPYVTGTNTCTYTQFSPIILLS